MPPVDPVMRKMRAVKAANATMTRTPTFSCDHWTSCWLGTDPLGLKRVQRAFPAATEHIKCAFAGLSLSGADRKVRRWPALAFHYHGRHCQTTGMGEGKRDG